MILTVFYDNLVDKIVDPCNMDETVFLGELISGYSLNTVFRQY